ncbi:long-chain fatty acid--CoA ligase [Salinigranum halophilum]|jgi:fatty-acyl-CoA synthase|uniref:long-chain fatty acid--CoA ligase n=1 Tax=Salinigranum halophilum TaxID=2565931 RepID=UPI00115E0490|nr:long-chain fatty acid--CoA ligase [Salinigranum halophilum]
MVGTTAQTLRPFLWRAAKLYPEREVVSRTHEGIERTTYAAYERRVAQLAHALDDAGVGRDDRIATVCWNHTRHFETYFGVPCRGSQLHTINPLLPDHHVQYIVENAADALLFVDPSLVEKVESASRDDGGAFDTVEQFVVMGEEVPETSLDPVTDYESFLAGHDETYEWPDLDEETPAGMCYTSGTTGRPKGVEYTQQMMWAHTMGILPEAGLDIRAADVVMPVVPMFHVMAWGLPHAVTAAGAKHVYPGPSPDPADIAHLIEEEGVTFTAGVPTVWLGLLDYLEEHDADLSSLERIAIGGAAAPKSLIRTYEEEYDVQVLHAWGMTETSPVAAAAHLKPGMESWPAEKRDEKRVKQGLVLPGLEFKVIGEDGEVPWNDEEFGELWIRGPWVTTEYFGRPDANETDFEDGWLKTGDVVRVDSEGYIQIVDRAKDVIKSGGEWISSQELENAIMAHDDVSEATVVGVPHERWQERPVAFVVAREGVGEGPLKDDIMDFLREDYPTWWLPDDVVYIESVPKTATGKFDKKVLREEYADHDVAAPAEAAPDDE